eukprot:2498537-Rhodomonas_salina.1
MTPIATQRALIAAEIKIKLLEKALQQRKPYRYSTLSTRSNMDERDTNFAQWDASFRSLIASDLTVPEQAAAQR